MPGPRAKNRKFTDLLLSTQYCYVDEAILMNTKNIQFLEKKNKIISLNIDKFLELLEKFSLSPSLSLSATTFVLHFKG